MTVTVTVIIPFTLENMETTLALLHGLQCTL